MYGLIGLIIRYSGVITFVILESICMYLAVRYNKNQQEIYNNSVQTFSGFVYQRYDKLMKYAQLANIADSTAAENARLYARLGNAKFNEYLIRDSTLVKDSLNKIRQQYTYIAASVISNSISLPNNYITLNRGRRHGVNSGMAVITSKGVVGIVRNVSENFSEVMSILHQQSKISASLKSTNYFGTMHWRDAGNITKMSLETIPKHAELHQGDTVQTSGYSFIFPEGIPIGIISNYQVEPGSNYFSAEVQLFEDLGKLRYVYIVDNLMIHEQTELKKEALEPQKK
jgi:rod shape-determining protein MreC